MLIYDYKLSVSQVQTAAIDEAIRTVQFIRNTCVRQWMDGRGLGDNDLQVSCSQLAKDFPFAACLNSQARQTAADRAWLSIARFSNNCREKKPGKKGYPRFQHNNRSVEYETTGWKLEPDGMRITQHPRERDWHAEDDRRESQAQKSASDCHLLHRPDQAGASGQAGRWLLWTVCRESRSTETIRRPSNRSALMWG